MAYRDATAGRGFYRRLSAPFCTLAFAWTLAVTSPLQANAQSPSFDCRKARYPDEFAICRTPELAELDTLVAAAYAYLKATRGRPYADEIGIPSWRMRQACQSDVLCIKERQIEALNAYRSAGAPVPLQVTRAPSPEPQPAPSPEPEKTRPHAASSGTGIFVTNEGHLVTNAHVVKDCLDIQVGMGQGNFEAGKLVARDPTNDLALLKVNAKPARVGALRFGARQGENVEAFGYPLSDVLATSGNFTTGIVTALAGSATTAASIRFPRPSSRATPAVRSSTRTAISSASSLRN